MTNPYIIPNSSGGGNTSPVLASSQADKNQSGNPYSSGVQQITHSPNESDKDSFGYKISSFYDYIRSAMAQPDITYSGSKFLEGLKQVGSNVSSDVSNAIDYYKNTPLKKIGSDIKDMTSSQNNPLSLSNMGSTLAHIPSSMVDMIQKPVEALTTTVNDNGVARPASKQEQAANMQSAAGTAAMFITQAKMNKMFLPENVSNPFGELTPVKFGRLSISAGTKQAAKVIGSNTLSGALAGGVGGAISGIGQDDQANQIIAGALSFAPLSAAMSVFGIRGRIRDLEEAKGDIISKGNESSTIPLAALNSMRVDPSDPVSVLAGKVNSITNADDLVKAAIHDRLDQGDGYIVTGVSDTFGKELQGKLNPSTSKKPPVISGQDAKITLADGGSIPKGTYIPPSDLTNLKGGPFGTEVKFEDPFDKLAYYVAKDDPSETVKGLLNDAVQQTGLSPTEIISHGQYIRQQANQAVKSQKLTPRSQPEIDEANNRSLLNGTKIAASTPIGGVMEDNLGTKWTKVDENNITDGKLTLPLTENTTLQRIGRSPSESYLYNAYANMPAQEFRPSFNRDNPGNVRYYHSPTTNTLLAIPDGSLSQAGIKQFQASGFVPKEIVSYAGQEVRVEGTSKGQIKVQDPVSRTIENVDPGDLRRTNNSLVPDIFKSGKLTGTRTPILSQETYLGELYKDYISQFKQNINSTTSTKPYSSFYQKFFSDHKIDPVDYNNIHTYFLGKLSDDIAGQVLDPREVTIREALRDDIRDQANSDQLDTIHDLTNLATSNNLFFSAEGGGKYRLRYQDDGSTYKIVGSIDEAKKAISDLRQVKGLDQDGGNSGAIPTSIGNIGGLAQNYSPVPVSRWNGALDEFRATGIGKNLTPIGRRLQSIDNVFGSQLYPKFLDIQNKIIEKRNLTERDINLKDLRDRAQNIMDLGGRIGSDRRSIAGDNLETSSLAEIKSGKYIGRASNPMEEALAKELSKQDVGKVKELLLKTRLADTKTTYGSDAWNKNFTLASQDYDPETVKAAKQVALSVKAGKGIISGDLVLKLAGALEDPSTALDASNHARVNGITGKEVAYKNQVSDWFDRASKVLGINPNQSYLPNILNSLASGEEGPLPEGVAKEIANSGLVNGSLIRDPNLLISRYYSAIINHKVGYHDAVNSWEDGSLDEVNKITDPKFKGEVPGLKALVGDYARVIRGQSIPEDALHNAARRRNALLGFSTPSANSVMSLMSLSNIALRPMLAIRDFHNIAGESYISFGKEFTERFLGNAVSKEIVEDMKRKNLLPESSAREFVDPTGGSGDLLEQGGVGQVLRKSAEKSFNLSGQEAAYEHANASIYKTSMDLAEKYLGQLQRNEINKDQAYDKMGIRANYGAGLVKHIDDLISQGKTDQAADFYGQVNMRMLSHVYGLYNNPIGWNSTFGRVMGQWGSWSANATATMMDQYSKGTGKDIAGKVLRAGMWNKATVIAGAGLGLNLGSWQVSNPISAFPNTGPIPSMIGNLQDDYEQGRPLTGSLMHLGENFLPYSAAARGWVKGLDAVGQGNLIQGLMVAGGAPKAK